MSVLTVSGLRVDLAGRRVIDDASLSFGAGEFLGLPGPNGAGKTTLLRSLLGLVPVAAGRIDDAGHRGRDLRRQVGYVPQRHDVAWDFPLDVRTVVATGTRAELDRPEPWMATFGVRPGSPLLTSVGVSA